MMLRILGLAAAVGLATTVAYAQTVDPTIPARKDALKAMGGATRPVVPMLRGEAPFDLATVQTALRTYQESAERLPALFPDTSKTGGETEALPIIWQQKDQFNAGFTKLAADARAASAAITNEATFRANFPGVVRNCQTCHDTYRVKK
jgi:cytochrome c556